MSGCAANLTNLQNFAQTGAQMQKQQQQRSQSASHPTAANHEGKIGSRIYSCCCRQYG
jgi:hypothetical protein